MSEKNLTVSPERLGAEIRELTRQAKAMTLYYGVEIGRRLEAALESARRINDICGKDVVQI